MVMTALLFPGQGSQQVGMGRDLAQSYPQCRSIYEEADEVLGFPLSRLCFDGPEEALDDTINTQPALFVTSLAILRALEAALPADMVAGHSLGELTALVACGSMDLAEGLLLVRERGRLMKLAGERNPGGMAAVLKMDDEEVAKACDEASSETGRPVQIANHNAPGQVVISGDRVALGRATELLKQRGARRIVPLAVSIAAHSPLMSSVVKEYRASVDATPLRVPRIPVIGNISARPMLTIEEIRDELTGQLTWPVRWTASVQWMADQGVARFAEIGPKDVLTRLVERTVPGAEAINIGDLTSVQSWAA